MNDKAVEAARKAVRKLFKVGVEADFGDKWYGVAVEAAAPHIIEQFKEEILDHATEIEASHYRTHVEQFIDGLTGAQIEGYPTESIQERRDRLKGLIPK